MDYLEFKNQFEADRAAFSMPTDCSELRDPVLESVTIYAWRFEWHLMFADNHYIRIWEDYVRVKGLADSRRARFAYHYGPTPPLLDADGTPKYQSADPVAIRIDNCSQSAHLHFKSPQPHIPQDKVDKLNLHTIEKFTFVNGIIKHRATGKSLEKTLGFKVIK